MSITAKCACGKSFKAKSELAGKRVKCPACGQPIQVPQEQPVQAAGDGSTSRTIPVTCQCGRSFKAPEKLAGKQVACPACKNPLSIPQPQAAPSAPIDAELVDPLGNLGDFGNDPLAGAPAPAASMPMPAHGASTGALVNPAKTKANSTAKIILFVVLGVGGVLFLGCAGLFVIGFVGGFKQALDEARGEPDMSGYGPGYTEGAGLMDYGVTGHQPFGDFSATVPEGWVSVTPQPGKTKALMVIGTNPDFAGMIVVDVGPPTQPTAQATAEAFAGENSGQIAADGVALDGVDGVRVTTSSSDLAAPREIIIVHRNDKVYLLMGAGLNSIDVKAAVERVRSTWKWKG